MSESKIEKGSGNVFADLGFGEEEAHNLVLRSGLMLQVEKIVKDGGLTQQQAADLLGVSRSTADRIWLFARAWLYDHVRPPEP